MSLQHKVNNAFKKMKLKGDTKIVKFVFSAIFMATIFTAIAHTHPSIPPPDYYRGYELDATYEFAKSNGLVLLKYGDTGRPDLPNYGYAITPAGWDDSPFHYLAVGILSHFHFINGSGVEVFLLYAKAIYGISIFLFFGTVIYSAVSVLKLRVYWVLLTFTAVSLISISFKSLPFTLVGFTPQIVALTNRNEFIFKHNPYTNVDWLYGLSSSFLLIFISIWIFLLFYSIGKNIRFSGLFSIFLVSVLVLENVRPLDSFVLIPLFLLVLYCNKFIVSKTQIVLSFFLSLILIILMRILSSKALHFYWLKSTGFSFEDIQNSSNSLHRLFLGLSFNRLGWDYNLAGLGGVYFNDNYVFQLVKSIDSRVTLYSREYNTILLDEYKKIVFSDLLGFIELHIQKLLFTPQFFTVFITFIFLTTAIFFLSRDLMQQHLTKVIPWFSLRNFWIALASMVILSLLPILVSRPFSPFMGALKISLEISLLFLYLFLGVVFAKKSEYNKT